MNDEHQMTDEERVAFGVQAMHKIEEGIKEYLLATKDHGDAETLSVGLVLFEAQGIDGETDSIYTRTNYFVVTERTSPAHAVGVYEVAGMRLMDDAS